VTAPSRSRFGRARHNRRW